MQLPGAAGPVCIPHQLEKVLCRPGQEMLFDPILEKSLLMNR